MGSKRSSLDPFPDFGSRDKTEVVELDWTLETDGRILKYFFEYFFLICMIFLFIYQYYIYRQSPVKNQPIKHKVDNFYVLTKVPHNTRET